MSDRNLEAFLAVAQTAVRKAGVKAKQTQSGMRIQAHKEGGDLVTDADLAAEEQVISNLQRDFPDHGFISEEQGETRADAEHVWILDPIDGTKYYARGVPFYTVSLALRIRSELVLGVVYCPEFDRMYSAASGLGSQLNGNPIRCVEQDNLHQALIYLEIPNSSSDEDELSQAIDRMALLIQHSYRVRIVGVGSIGLCFCASGGFDVYLNLCKSRKLWDYAAGWVIAREAGAKVKEFEPALIAGPSALCDQILPLIGIDEVTNTKSTD